MKIRNADLKDLPTLSTLAQSFHDDANITMSFDRDSFCSNWEKLLQTGVANIFVSESDDKQVKAMLGAVLYPDVNSSDLVATEMFWYSDKASRGAGLPLFSAFESWAKNNGAKHVIMVHLATSMPEKLRRFYNKKGYTEIETHYMKEIK